MAEPTTEADILIIESADAPRLSPEEILLVEELMKKQEEEEKRAEDEMRAILAKLAEDIENKLSTRSSRRGTKEAEWLESYRLYLGSLSTGRVIAPQQIVQSDNGNNKPEYNLVKPKCKIAIAQTHSAQFAGGDKNWDIIPSPSLEPGADPRQVAIAAEKMEAEINDQLNHTKWGYQSRLAMEDRVILGTGIIKGPAPSMYASLTYESVQDPMTGQVTNLPTYKVKNKPIVKRVDPWFFFPDDTVNDIELASDVCEIHPMSKLQMAKLRKNDGFIKEAIDEVMAEEPRAWQSQTFSQYASMTASGGNVWADKYVLIEYHGPITGAQLRAANITPASESPDDMYFGEVWVCQGRVLRIELSSIDGCYLPYSVCPWLPDPGSIFGFGMPQEIKDAQRIAQKTLNMILSNASKSSGPIVVIDTKRIEDQNGNYEIGPDKVLTVTDYPLDTIDQAFKFFVVPNITSSLFPILELSKVMAQEESGIQEIAGGLQSPKAQTDSATGLAIIDQNATTVSDFLNEAWDDRVVEKVITRMYHYNMQFNPKPELMGDFEVDVRSSSEARKNQMTIRDLEKLSVEAAQDPEMGVVINRENLTKVRLMGMHIPNLGIVRSDEEIQELRQQQAQNQPPDPATLKHQADMRKLDLEEKRLQIEEMKLQFELQQGQRREEMENQERMMANAARFQESQARVLEAQTLLELEYVKLAAKNETDRAKIMADLEKNSAQSQRELFFKGIDAQMKFNDQKLKAEEAQIKRDMGTGY